MWLCSLCRKPQIIKNKYVSTLIGTILIYLSVAFILPVGNFSVYITSYIHLYQDFVTMHFGTYFSPILTLIMTFARSIGGVLEGKIGFMPTTFLGLGILLITNLFFFQVRNIWACYFEIVLMGLGAGIAISLLPKNLTLYRPKKKGGISGIIGVVTIVSSALFAFGGEKIINLHGDPVDENQVYPKEIAESTKNYYILGFFTVPIGGLLGFLFLYEYKKEDDPTQYISEKFEIKTELQVMDGNLKDKEEEKDNDEGDKLDQKPEEEEAQIETPDNTFEKELEKIKQKRHIKQVFKTFRFYRISFSILLLNFPVMFMVNTGRIFGAIIGINGTILQLLAIFQMFGMIIIGPIVGKIIDKKNPLFLLRIVTLICAIPGILLILFLENNFFFTLSIMLYLFGLIGNTVGLNPLIMEIYGIQESVILGGFVSTFSKIGEILTTTVAFFVSFMYPGNSIRIPYKIIYILSSVFSYLSFYILMIEEIDKYQYDDSDVEINQTEMSRESILSNL